MIRLWLVLLAAVVPGVIPAPAATNRPPNIVFVLADDLGWTDAGFAGSRFYLTPALDALAASGLRFSSFYMSHDCVASRASILSGQYSARTGVFAEGPSLERGEALSRRLVPPPNRPLLASGAPTFASVLKAAGYTTGLFGRWPGGTNATELPAAYGFEEALVSRGRPLAFTTEPPSEIPAGAYLSDFLTAKALDFVQRNRERPFLLFLSHLGVRPPYEAKPELVAKFAKLAPAGGHRDATYAAMIASLDESVGLIMARLDEWKLSENTVVVFTSDNGGVGGYLEAENGARRTGPTDNAPLRSGKGSFYEGGLRVPCLVRWPGVTRPGSRSTQPGIHVDLFPTLCAIAGVPNPAGYPLDGESLVPILRDPGAHLGRDALFWHFPGYLEAEGRPGWRAVPTGAIRAGNFKLLEFFEDNRIELYNVVEDLGEKNNLVRSLPEKAQELQAKLAAWRKALGAAMPTPKPPPGSPPPVTPAPQTPAPASPSPTNPAPPAATNTPPAAPPAPAPTPSPAPAPAPAPNPSPASPPSPAPAPGTAPLP